MEVKFCKECKWSRTSSYSYEVRCVNPYVVSKDPWALTRIETEKIGDVDFACGKSCHEERAVKWFGVCGMKGKLWDKKEIAPVPPGDE